MPFEAEDPFVVGVAVPESGYAGDGAADLFG